MKLPFILGMEVLCRAHMQLDLETCMLTLRGDNGSVTEVLGSYKQTQSTVIDCISLCTTVSLL